jgi:NAD(P)-dependent dehydrogenase (short-subunit alcohol dehydrogenase family)
MTGGQDRPGAALVTGGARRIGRAICLKLAQAGYAIAIHCQRSQAEANLLKDEIETAGGAAGIVAADLGDRMAAERMIAEAGAALGPLTLLVNNAAVFEPDELGSIGPETWDRHMAVNLAAPVFLARAFAQQAPAGRSSIVNILDQRVLKPTPLFFSYGLSKSALHTATHMLAQALAPAIRVNGIAPGPVLPSKRQSAQEFAAQCRAMPLGRGSTPEEVADAVLYLARARSVTGAVIAVDAGQHVAWQTPDLQGVRE